MKREQTGNEDQRYCNREDHEAARSWFQKRARQLDKQWTKADRLENLRRLTLEVSAAVDAAKKGRGDENL